MTIREKLEERERQTLSPMASLSAESRGRQFPAEPCPIRTEYQRDRDRIIHSKSFRRLKHKTQVFLSPEGDHYRTRLTHTLEVSQIGRTIARALGLNEDLVEAAAMGHDIGHTPFGHAGEYALREICPLGFDHNEQSVRVAERLENDGKGLNLTWEVRDAIRCHSSGCPSAQTFEGIPELRGRGRGDQYVTVRVQIPTSLNGEQKEALRAFAEAMGEDVPEESGLKGFFDKHKKRK